MIIRFGLLARKRGLTTEEFQDYWKETHGPLAARLLKGVRGYHQNHILNLVRTDDAPNAQYSIDGLSELWFDDLAASKTCLTPEDLSILKKDEARVFENLKFLTGSPQVVISASHDGPLLKRIALLRRRPEIDTETFKNEWLSVHAALVRSMPHVQGYTQNVVVERVVKRGEPAAYDDLPVDGVAELWFNDSAEMLESFASPAGQRTLEHGKTFLAGMTTFLVRVHKVV